MWRKIWGPHPADQSDALHAALVKHWISSGLFLERLLGNYACGLVALEAFFTDNPEVTADYVATRLDGYLSEDTARRKLNAMVKAGMASSRREGRTVFFKLDPAVAEAAVAFMKGEPVTIPALVAASG